MRLFETLGVPLKTERGNRVFPCRTRLPTLSMRFAVFKGRKTINAEATALLFDGKRVIGVKTADGEFLPKMFSWPQEAFPIL